MAGSMMDAPGYRLAYDRDGTQAFYYATAVRQLTGLTTTQLKQINTEAGVSYNSSNGWVSNPNSLFITGNAMVFLFPALMDISGIFFNSLFGYSGLGVGTANIYGSADTLTGIDGTWASLGTTLPAGATKPFYRETPYVFDTAGVGLRGLRLISVPTTGSSSTSLGIQALHLYGKYNSGATIDRIAFWHPTSNEEIPYTWFDEGDVVPGSTADVQFRLKNTSSTMTANNTVVSLNSVNDTSPSVQASYLLDNGSGVYQPTYTQTSLAAGAISGVYTLRRTTPSNAVVSTWSVRLCADVGSWS